MKTAVFFILLKKSLLHSPWVSGVREQETIMKSLSDTSVSRGTVPDRDDRVKEMIKEWTYRVRISNQVVQIY